MLTGLKKTNLKNAVFFILFVLLIAGILLATVWTQNYILLTGLLLIGVFALFFVRFEKHGPIAVEILLLASMATLTIVGNFCSAAMLPFQAGTALVILSGIGFGPEFGFLVGALARLVMNFFYGQGSWTLWQMAAWGILGLVAGLLFKKGRIPRKWYFIGIYGFIGTMVLYGGIMDTSTVVFSLGSGQPEMTLSGQSILAIYTAGASYNLVHALGTAAFLCVFSYIILLVFDRVITKFGLHENA